ncbi:hypothetical protein [Pseudonocardia charpentierae]|uniref:RibD C-terminal domain-containing protein n=1 Tax=Pseudonocardia charpentierae TaxID=3075545 RepID=A0ABU2NHF3_9PSEU|nr:hypothetical protein [Pseudonocardia sp. DSM 45834]MDT0353392.1 hypothetical protein [Pseudonocardia sp. DSM 45834]
MYYTTTTLDGFIADPADSLDWLLVQDVDRDGPLHYDTFIAGGGALAMSATTYEWIRARVAVGRDKWGLHRAHLGVHPPNLPTIKGADVRFVAGRPPLRIPSW